MTRHQFQGPAGSLDGRIHGEGAPVLLLHPHPKHGGTKGTRLVYCLAEALAEAGFQAIRFDFRGVGQSEGAYDGGPGETDDALSVWDAVSQKRPAAVIGFSFGGGIAIRVAGQRAVPALLCIATPARVRDADLQPATEGGAVSCPAAVLIGDQDELVSVEEADAVAHALDAPLTILPGADHFLTPTHHDAATRWAIETLQGLL